MRRKLLNLATVASLLLCLSFAALWVRSYWVWDRLRWNASLQSSYEIGASMGTIEVDSHRLMMGGAIFSHPPGFQYIPWQPVNLLASTYENAVTDRNWLGFGVQSYRDAAISHYLIRVPCWFVVGLMAAAPVWRWRQLVPRRRVAGGTCRGCGYDLRATPDRCPECGTESAAAR